MSTHHPQPSPRPAPTGLPLPPRYSIRPQSQRQPKVALRPARTSRPLPALSLSFSLAAAAALLLAPELALAKPLSDPQYTGPCWSRLVEPGLAQSFCLIVGAASWWRAGVAARRASLLPGRSEGTAASVSESRFAPSLEASERRRRLFASAVYWAASAAAWAALSSFFMGI